MWNEKLWDIVQVEGRFLDNILAPLIPAMMSPTLAVNILSHKDRL